MPLTQRSLQGLWLKTLLFTLFGYAFMGRGFAYLFVGEMVLILGVLVFLRSQRVMLLSSDSVLLLWTMFAFWGFCRTVPFFAHYRFDAARDAVLWGYGAFTLLVVAFVNTSNDISRALNTYRRFLKWYLPLLPVLLLLSNSFRSYMPILPWSNGVTVVLLKSGDAGANLAAAALFFLLFPDSGPEAQRKGSQRRGLSVNRLFCLAGWAIGAILIASTTRGGFLAIVVPITMVSVLKIQKIGWKVAAFAVVGTLFAMLALESGLSTIQIKGHTVTPERVITTVSSAIGASSAAPEHEGTAEWRLDWWRKIVHYTVFGPYFWTGKGFGVNLAEVDEPSGMTRGEVVLRSPHNGNMTVLARMGVPGITLWIALNGLFIFRLLKAYRRAIRLNFSFWSGLYLWIFCYWLAIFINMSFDVVLEGPPGGIWFWSIIGFGVATMRVEAYEGRQRMARSQFASAGYPSWQTLLSM